MKRWTPWRLTTLEVVLWTASVPAWLSLFALWILAIRSACKLLLSVLA